MFKFNPTLSTTTSKYTESFNENSYNRLKLNHGLGYDWDEEMQWESSNSQEGGVGTKNRKINKVPFKVLDAP